MSATDGCLPNPDVLYRPRLTGKNRVSFQNMLRTPTVFLYSVVLLAWGLLNFLGGAPASAAEKSRPAGWQVASLAPTKAPDPVQLPRILDDADVKRYQRIFHVQEKGDWAKADLLIGQLKNKILLGHVLAQRFLHPTKYRSRYPELKKWLAKYADHPDARRLYKLALRRKPRNWRAPKRPTIGSLYVVDVNAARLVIPRKRLKRSQRREARKLKRQIRWWLRKGWTKSVKRVLESGASKRLLSSAEYDQAQARLGAAYFAAGRDEWAYTWASRAAKRSARYLPEAHWTAGLAAWRMKRFDVAAGHFEAVAEAGQTSSWMLTAAAFWAARTNLVNRKPEKVTEYLKIAASHPRTFYGLLARRILGVSTTYDWAVPELEESGHEVADGLESRDAIGCFGASLGTSPRRTGTPLLIRPGRSRSGPRYLALASRTAMPALSVRLVKMLFPNGGGYDGAAYPIPPWKPKKGSGSTGR